MTTLHVLEMVHTAGLFPCHRPAGGATLAWLRGMRDQKVRQPCLTCGKSVGWHDVTISREHSRDWSVEP